jgi:hypothetical protein
VGLQEETLVGNLIERSDGLDLPLVLKMRNVMGSVRESRKDANLSSTDPCSFSGRFARLTDLSS